MRSILIPIMTALFTLTSATPAIAHGPMECRAFNQNSNALASAPLLLPAPKIFSPNVDIRKIEIKAATVPTSAKDPAFQKSRLMLLALLADPIFASGSIKDTLRDGELRLGASLGDGSSIEFEYRGDQRGDEMVLRLNRITLYKANGQSVSLDRNPVSEDGRTLITKAVTLIDHYRTNERDERYLKEMKVLDLDGLVALTRDHEFIGTALQEAGTSAPLRALDAIQNILSESDRSSLAKYAATRQTIEVPVVIEGALMAELAAWLKRLPDISREELRKAAATGDGLRSLVWKTKFKQSWDYIWNKVIIRQSAKLPIVIASLSLVAYVWSQLLTVSVPFTNPFSAFMPNPVAVERMVEGAKTVTERPEYKTVRSVLDGLNVPAHELQEFDAKARKDINDSVHSYKPSEALNKMQVDLTKNDAQEAALGGQPQHFPEKGLTASAGLLPNFQSGYMLVHYPKQEKMVMIPISNVGEYIPNAVVLNIKKESYPNVYNALLEKVPKKQ